MMNAKANLHNKAVPNSDHIFDMNNQSRNSKTGSIMSNEYKISQLLEIKL